MLKGIVLNDISYSLFLLSFFIFFVFLVSKKTKALFLYAVIAVFIIGLFFKFKSLEKSEFSSLSTINKITQSKLKDNSQQNMASIKGIKQISCFEEHFTKAISNYWDIQRFSFPENGCIMKDSQISVHNSVLTITVRANEKQEVKPYEGGEISSKSSFLYGKFSVRMKNPIAPGTVSSFFLMNQWRTVNWEHKEIDIEFLGKNTCAVQFTVHDYKDGGKKHIYNKFTYPLGFDSSTDFHLYSIIWSKDSISWLVDEKLAHTEKEILIIEPMNIRLNHWAANPADVNCVNWLGSIDRNKLPSRVYYDYIQYFRLP